MKMNKYIISLLALFLLFTGTSFGQKVGVKTNALYWATATPNLGVEVALSKKFTLGLSAGWNPFDLRKKTYNDGSVVESKIKHVLLMPELKYWNCQSFQRSYWGIHGIYSHFNMGGISFLNPLEDHRYQGDAYGGGISYGYQWAIGNRWGLEASVGAGYIHLDYKKYDKQKCGDFIGEETYDYWGPTKVEVSFIYFIK